MRIDAIATARSFLFVPGDRPDRFGKAISSGADQVIIDLEDAVASSRKADARTGLAGWLSQERPVLVRVNAPGTTAFEEDLRACDHAGVAGIVVPKAETRAELAKARHLAPRAALLPLVETARGLSAAEALASADGVVRLLFGSVDFQLDLGIPEDGEQLSAFRSHLVLASRLAGAAAPVDGVTLDLESPTTLSADVARARAFGFGGKLCVHPRQVPWVNDGFMPTAAEQAWAWQIVEGASQSGKGGAVAIAGQMIDRPVILKAERILARIGATRTPGD